MKLSAPFFFVSVCCWRAVGAFLPATPTRRHRHQASTLLALSSKTSNDDVRSKSFLLSQEEVNPIIKLGKGDKEKVVNAFGLWCAVVSLITGPIWAAAMSIVDMVNKINEDWDPNRAVYDSTGKVWAKTWLTMANSFPVFSGDIEKLKQGHGPCLYVANHASWLDIPILCTVLDPVFKFVAKGELTKVPCIGQQLIGGKHIIIDREDRRSQLRTFKEGIGWLKKGVPIMAFPEGMRSRDGRLMDFKGGLFSMAVKTKVPIVPITISHAHAVMPGNSFFPVQSGAGKLHVHVHEPIDTNERTEEELAEMVKQSFLSTLPFEQHPLRENVSEDMVKDMSEDIVLDRTLEHTQHDSAAPQHHHAAKLESLTDTKKEQSAEVDEVMETIP